MTRRRTTESAATVATRVHHVANVVPLHRPRINPLHPSVTPPAVFDQAQAAPDRTVVLTRIEAQLIATLLRTARAHLPSPRACDEAISLLVGER
jgi:hypothetical protein